MPTVLDRPHANVVELGSEPQRLKRPVIGRCDPQLTARGTRCRFERDKHVRALVCVHTDHDHLHRPFVGDMADGADLRRTHLSRGDATLL